MLKVTHFELISITILLLLIDGWIDGWMSSGLGPIHALFIVGNGL